MISISPVEGILIGDVIFGFIVLIIQLKVAIDRGENRITDTGVNPINYLFRRMPEGTYSTRQPFKKAWAWFGSIIGLVGFGWVAINVPEWIGLALVYVLLGLISMVVGLVEEIDPYKSEITACIVWGFGKWDEQILIGIGISIPFILLTASGQLFQVMQIKGMPVASFIVTVFMVPLIEESVFRGVIAPSIAEDAGVIHGAFVSAFIFAVYHAYAYKFNIFAMMVAFVFGVISAFVDLIYKSQLPGWIAHTLINLSAFMFWMGSACGGC